MAYLVFSSHKGEEIGRRRLEGAVTIGRAPDCDVSLRDILLSRHHCKLEPSDGGWVLVDLGSKNGTFVGNQPVNRHALADGESFSIGRVKVRFRAGALSPEKEKQLPPNRQKRPADPFDALAGTVAGFKYEAPSDEHVRPVEQFPVPKPAPFDSGQFVGVTDSGRFVGVTDDVWLEDKEHGDGSGNGNAARDNGDAAAAHAGTVARSAVAHAAAATGVVRRDLVRPKAPEGADAEAPAPADPGPPPKPPRVPMRQRVGPFLKKLGRRLRLVKKPAGNGQG